MRKAIASWGIGTGILDASFNITAELACNTSLDAGGPVPTLSQWGLIALVLCLIAGAGFSVFVRGGRRAGAA